LARYFHPRADTFIVPEDDFDILFGYFIQFVNCHLQATFNMVSNAS